MPEVMQNTIKGTERRGTWPIQVAKLTSNLDFPLSKDEACEKIIGIAVKGEDIGQIMNRLDYPIESPADLMDKISRATE